MNSAEENLLIKWIWWQSVSFHSNCHCPWANEQSGHGGKDGSYAWPQQHKTPLLKAGSWVPNLPEAKTNIEPSIKLHFQGDWQVDHIGLLPFWKEQHFVLTEINTYSGYRFAFSAYRGQITSMYLLVFNRMVLYFIIFTLFSFKVDIFIHGHFGSLLIHIYNRISLLMCLWESRLEYW